MKKVHILLSTYNGAKYIRELLDSLLAQTYPNIEIHIRDDGSSDETCEIIRSYTDSRIHLYQEENVGFRKSFAWLLSSCTGADYYAFCDQDDIWHPQKISRSVRGIEKFSDTPAMYISDFWWADENCNPVKRNAAAKKPHTLVKYITTGDMNTFGFTEVFNEEAAAAVRGYTCTDLLVHDQILYLYCLCRGKVVWGDIPLAYYRRFGGNASVQEYQGGSYFTHVLWQLKTFLFSDGRDRVYGRFEEFYHAFSSKLPENCKEVFLLYINSGHKLKKTFYRGRYRDKLRDELAIRILFFIGKM